MSTWDRYINEFDQIVENQTDDGEPKGSAGKPSLDVLRGAELVNTALITVRYFGGIKLGIGGMVRAYGGAVNEVISQSNLVKYEKLITLEKDINFSAQQIANNQNYVPDEQREHNVNAKALPLPKVPKASQV